MDEIDRRAFCALAAASAGLLSGCSVVEDASRRLAGPEGERTVVTTRNDLESTFENLSPDETVYVSAENAPYRTRTWLDVDVDGVTVGGPGVRTLVKPAAGADVGGIRIGHNERCRDVTVRGIGFDGNRSEQHESVDRLHGIAVRDAENVALERNQIRRTHPRRHGDGGSGISVTRECSRVRVADNRVHEYGDRGVQVGGDQVQVFGNVVTHGLDRPIACDVWYPEGENHTAENVVVSGNVLGESVQGSLVGVARNTPVTSTDGYVSVFGNVGFGSHKSFCHLRGPREVRNVSVRNNVSVHRTEGLETETRRFSGVTVDAARGRNVAIGNNELYGYSGHGIRVESPVEGLLVQHNDVVSPALSGIRIAGRTDGVVEGNRVTGPGEAGICVERTAGLLVRGNHVRHAGTAGIVTVDSVPGRGTDVTGNHVTANSRQEGRSVPAILVLDTGVAVRGNTVQRRERDVPAIAEGESVGGNLYADNWADGERPWHIGSPTSTIRNHTPAVGVHRDVTTGAGENTVTVRFDRPHARPPRLSFGRTGGGIETRTFETDGDGNYVGVTLGTRNEGATLDVFVDDG